MPVSVPRRALSFHRALTALKKGSETIEKEENSEQNFPLPSFRAGAEPLVSTALARGRRGGSLLAAKFAPPQRQAVFSPLNYFRFSLAHSD